MTDIHRTRYFIVIIEREVCVCDERGAKSSDAFFPSSAMKLTDSFYYEETRGQCGRKLLREIGEERRTKIRLFAYESWPKPALISHWTIKTVWWSKSKCQIIERLGHRTNITK